MIFTDSAINNWPHSEVEVTSFSAPTKVTCADVPEAAPANTGWHGFIGQSEQVRRLKAHITGAKRKQLVVSSVLLLGTSGSGKSAIARAMASEIGTTFYREVAGPQFDVRKLASLLAEISRGDVIFLDEAHSLNREVQEELMKALDDKVIEFTLVLATDQPGVLVNALNRRISLQVHLGTYSETEMIALCTSFAKKKIWISAQGKKLLCAHCRGEPRKIRHMVEGLQRTFERSDQASKEDVRLYLDVEGYDRQYGNDSTERAYLSLLATGSPMALSKLKGFIGVDSQHIEMHIEPRLQERGWVKITSAGRELTDAGRMVAASYQVKTV